MKSTHKHFPTSGTNDIASISRDILVALRRIIRTVALHSRQLVEEHGLTSLQLAALHELARHGPMAARELAQWVQVSQPTITGVLDRLEQRQLITRTRSSKDRRALNIAMTDQGREVLVAAPPLLQQRFTEALGQLQSWEQTLILATLQRIAAMMDAGDLPAAPLLETAPDQL
jgi:DNA-binding MarR family transcriptional regulator